MKISVAMATRNRPEWVRMFLLQMANQTVRPDIVVIHENGQSGSMKEICKDIPIETDFIFSPETMRTPDFAIPALRRAIEHNPDVVFMMNDDNLYFSTHIEKSIEGLENGKYDVAYHSFANLLAIKNDFLEYFKSIEWRKYFGNIGVDDGFAMSCAAAKEYLAYLEFASVECKKPSWKTKYDQTGNTPATDHHSDGVRFAYLLHPQKEGYSHLRNVNFISPSTMSWVRHGNNLCSEFESTSALMVILKSMQLWEEGRI